MCGAVNRRQWSSYAITFGKLKLVLINIDNVKNRVTLRPIILCNDLNSTSCDIETGSCRISLAGIFKAIQLYLSYWSGLHSHVIAIWNVLLQWEAYTEEGTHYEKTFFAITGLQNILKSMELHLQQAGQHTFWFSRSFRFGNPLCASLTFQEDIISNK